MISRRSGIVGCLVISLLPTLAVAGDGILGTRGGSGTTFDAGSSSPVGPGSVVQLAIALGVVLLLVRYVMPKALTKFSKKLVTNATGGLRVEESASFAGGNLYVVRARQKTLLLSVSSTGVTCLADLTEPQSELDSQPTFQEMLDSSPGLKPSPSQGLDNPDPVEAALARLDRLDRMAQS